MRSRAMEQSEEEEEDESSSDGAGRGGARGGRKAAPAQRSSGRVIAKVASYQEVRCCVLVVGWSLRLLHHSQSITFGPAPLVLLQIVCMCGSDNGLGLRGKADRNVKRQGLMRVAPRRQTHHSQGMQLKRSKHTHIHYSMASLNLEPSHMRLTCGYS